MGKRMFRYLIVAQVALLAVVCLFFVAGLFDRAGEPGAAATDESEAPEQALELSTGSESGNGGDSAWMPEIDPWLETFQLKLREAWHSALHRDQRLSAMNALRTVGADPAQFYMIQEAMQGNDPELRRSAIRSTTFIDTEESNQLLLDVLESSDDTELKTAALFSLAEHEWKSNFLEPLIACVRYQAAPDVRIYCAEIVLNQPKNRERMVRTLRELRHSSANDDPVFDQFLTDTLSDLD